jgi:uncharacterized membrane protein YhaH (DUF805 family)
VIRVNVSVTSPAASSSWYSMSGVTFCDAASSLADMSDIAEQGAASPPGRLGVRVMALIVIGAMVVEYTLGVAVAIYVKVPAQGRGAGLVTAAGRSISDGSARLAIHVVLGLALILPALVITVRGFISREWAVVALSMLGLVTLVGAAESGATFVSTGHRVEAMEMAIGSGIALLAYTGVLFLASGPPLPARSNN